MLSEGARESATRKMTKEATLAADIERGKKVRRRNGVSGRG